MKWDTMRWVWLVTGSAIFITVGLIRSGTFDPFPTQPYQWSQTVGELILTDATTIWLDPILPTQYEIEINANHNSAEIVYYGVLIGAPDQYGGVAVSSQGMVRVWERGEIETSILGWETWPLASLVGYVGTEQTFWIRQHEQTLEIWLNRQHLWTGKIPLTCNRCQIGLWADGKGIVNFEEVRLFYK